MKIVRIAMAILALSGLIQCSYADSEVGAFNAAATTNWFHGGDKLAPHEAYIIVEPTCHYCHLLFNELKPYLDSKQFAARWIMVSFNQSESMPLSAGILNSRNKFEALQNYESEYDLTAGLGGNQAAGKSPKEAVTRVIKNNRFIERYGLATPAIIYKDRKNQVHIYQGLVSGGALESIIQDMKRLT